MKRERDSKIEEWKISVQCLLTFNNTFIIYILRLADCFCSKQKLNKHSIFTRWIKSTISNENGMTTNSFPFVLVLQLLFARHKYKCLITFRTYDNKNENRKSRIYAKKLRKIWIEKERTKLAKIFCLKVSD